MKREGVAQSSPVAAAKPPPTPALYTGHSHFSQWRCCLQTGEEPPAGYKRCWPIRGDGAGAYCGRVLPLEEFGLRKGKEEKPGARRDACKACHSKRVRNPRKCVYAPKAGETARACEECGVTVPVGDFQDGDHTRFFRLCASCRALENGEAVKVRFGGWGVGRGWGWGGRGSLLCWMHGLGMPQQMPPRSAGV